MSGARVYVSENHSAPMAPQHDFANNFDLDNPHQAMSSYARIMHEHTKKQLNIATNSARRRSADSSPTSPNESVSSTSS
ncbi:hypothetical protein GRF29_213g398034 [Pseudopithomyces chartarum]|uniref:Uncharacterized protein n=1 Tax=Pseudopithomyces chartarum TaxID=1892770 RepID=A0AAN6LM95_9PLEO|nr:hypothetical protein GRF29_213g398034 [Pseudopithomyces chartarum]